MLFFRDPCTSQDINDGSLLLHTTYFQAPRSLNIFAMLLMPTLERCLWVFLENLLLAFGQTHVGRRRCHFEYRLTRRCIQLSLFQVDRLVSDRTISSGTFSSGSSIADANGCNSSGLRGRQEGGTCMSEFDMESFRLLRTNSRPTTRASPSISSKNAVQTTPASLSVCHGHSVLLDISCFPLIVRHI